MKALRELWIDSPAHVFLLAVGVSVFVAIFVMMGVS